MMKIVEAARRNRNNCQTHPKVHAESTARHMRRMRWSKPEKDKHENELLWSRIEHLISHRREK
jgi:hypothetical protein